MLVKNSEVVLVAAKARAHETEEYVAYARFNAAIELNNLNAQLEIVSIAFQASVKIAQTLMVGIQHLGLDLFERLFEHFELDRHG